MGAPSVEFDERVNICLKELEIAKKHCIKESIRIGFLQLGQLYAGADQIDKALEAFSATRDYCTLPAHVVELAYEMTRLLIRNKSYSHARTWAAKGVATGASEVDRLPSSVRAMLNMLRLALSTLTLALDARPEEALTGLLVALEAMDPLSDEVHTEGPSARDPPTASPASADVLLSGRETLCLSAACAMACLDRPSLASMLLDSGFYRLWLETCPFVAELLRFYVDGDVKALFLALPQLTHGLSSISILQGAPLTSLFDGIFLQVLDQIADLFSSLPLVSLSHLLNITEAEASRLFQLWSDRSSAVRLCSLALDAPARLLVRDDMDETSLDSVQQLISRLEALTHAGTERAYQTLSLLETHIVCDT